MPKIRVSPVAVGAGSEVTSSLLDGVELTPEQTSDDIAPPSNRDRELLEDVPPHHG